MIRGAIYRVDLTGRRGHEQRGRRYGLVMSPTDLPLSVVTIVPTSTSAGSSPFRPELEVRGEVTKFLIDQLTTVDKNYVLGDPVDYLVYDEFSVVEEVVTYYLGL